MARRTRQGEKKSLAKVLEKQKPKCGLTAKAEHSTLLQPGGKTNSRRKAKPQGIVMAVLKTQQGEAAAGPEKSLGCAGLSREGQSSEHGQDTEQERCCRPWHPK